MLGRVLSVSIALAALVILASADATQVSPPGKDTPDDKLDQQAIAVALEFSKVVLTTTDVDKALKMVALPFFHQDIRGKSGKALHTPLVAEQFDEVKQEMAAYMALGNKEKKYGAVLNEPKLEFAVITYEKFLADGYTFGHVEFKKALDGVLKKSDRFVMISAVKNDEGTGSKRVHVPFGTLVSWRDGEPKVVGYTIPLVFRPKK